MADAPFTIINGSGSAPATCDARTLRATRLPDFDGNPGEAARRLNTLHVTVVGCGSIGSSVALFLARLGIATLDLCDPGCFKPESILTHPIDPALVGQPKASSIGYQCKELSPGTLVRAFDGPVGLLPPAALADTDLVVLASDNLKAEVETGLRCLAMRKPLCQPSVHGETLVAQVRFLRNDGDGPCPACNYSADEWAHLNAATHYSCAGGAGRQGQALATQPTVSTASLCALAASLAGMVILRHTLHLGRPLSDSVLEYCGFTGKSCTSPLRRNPTCPCDHTPWEIRSSDGDFATRSLRELAGDAGFAADTPGLAFDVAGIPFVETIDCSCGARTAIHRFVENGTALPCSACGRGVTPAAFFTHCPVPADAAAPILDRPLASHTGQAPAWVLVSDGLRPVLFRPATAGKENS